MFPINSAVLVKILSVLLVLGGTFGAGFIHGLRWEAASFNEYVGKQAQQAVSIVTRQGEATERVVTRYVRVRGEHQGAAQIVQKEVLREAQVNPGRCLDHRWGLLHDAAASGKFSISESALNEPGPAPSASDALGIVTSNYFRHHECADKLDALQAWVREQEAVRP